MPSCSILGQQTYYTPEYTPNRHLLYPLIVGQSVSFIMRDAGPGDPHHPHACTVGSQRGPDGSLPPDSRDAYASACRLERKASTNRPRSSDSYTFLSCSALHHATNGWPCIASDLHVTPQECTYVRMYHPSNPIQSNHSRSDALDSMK
jgi:hypothetical protein